MVVFSHKICQNNLCNNNNNKYKILINNKKIKKTMQIQI